MTITELETRTISLCIASLQSRDADVWRRALVKILDDRKEIIANSQKQDTAQPSSFD